jgi:hypothetical protein
MQLATSLVARLVIGMVVPADAVGPKVLTAQIDKFTTNLECGKIEEVPYVFDWYLAKCTVEAQHGVLEDIVCLLPPLKAWTAAEHPPGEDKEAVAGIRKEDLSSLGVALTHCINEATKPRVAVWVRGGIHTPHILPT